MDEAHTFVKVITGNDGSIVAWQVFDDSEKKDRRKAQWRYGTFGEQEDWLQSRNSRRCGVYMMINVGDGKGRKAPNVVRIRAVFLDTDGAPPEPAVTALTPHMVIESSPGRYHLYWLVVDCQLEQFPGLQKAVALRFGGDTTVHDLCRVMRVPGFYHHKKEAFLTRIVTHNDIPPYTVDDVVNRLSLDMKPLQTAAKSDMVQVHNGNAAEVSMHYVDPTTGEIVDLGRYAAKHPDFHIATALRKHKPEKVLNEPRDGKQHIRCPFESEHTEKAPDNATYCIDGGDSNTNGFVIHCMHEHCAGRDRLHFLSEMLRLGWLPLSALTGTEFIDDREPTYVPQKGADKLKNAGFNALSGMERGMWLYIEFSMWFFFGGTLPDNDWLTARHLGTKQEEWTAFRELCINLGLLKVEGGRLVNEGAHEEYMKAKRLYNDKIRGGRMGGIIGEKKKPK